MCYNSQYILYKNVASTETQTLLSNLRILFNSSGRRWPRFRAIVRNSSAQSKLLTLFVQSWTEATPRGSTSKHGVNRCRDIPHFQLKFRDSCTRIPAAAEGGSGRPRRSSASSYVELIRDSVICSPVIRLKRISFLIDWINEWIWTKVCVEYESYLFLPLPAVLFYGIREAVEMIHLSWERMYRHLTLFGLISELPDSLISRIRWKAWLRWMLSQCVIHNFI